LAALTMATVFSFVMSDWIASSIAGISIRLRPSRK
jgi:hypothetical protein